MQMAGGAHMPRWLREGREQVSMVATSFGSVEFDMTH